MRHEEKPLNPPLAGPGSGMKNTTGLITLEEETPDFFISFTVETLERGLQLVLKSGSGDYFLKPSFNEIVSAAGTNLLEIIVLILALPKPPPILD